MNEKSHPSPSNAQQRSATPSATQSTSRVDAAQRGGAAKDARAIGSQAAGLASDVAGQVAHSAERQFAGGKDRAAEAISDIAGALRQTGKQLLAKEMPVANDYLGRLAKQVDGVSSYLQKKEFGDVVGDLESFARREPFLFMGGAFLVGLLGGRFVRSSQTQTATLATEGRGSGR